MDAAVEQVEQPVPGRHTMELSCAAVPPTRSEPSNQASLESQPKSRRQLQRCNSVIFIFVYFSLASYIELSPFLRSEHPASIELLEIVLWQLVSRYPRGEAGIPRSIELLLLICANLYQLLSLVAWPRRLAALHAPSAAVKSS